MRNERGLTLVELLAVLALVGIVMTLLISVFINGSKASNRIATNQQLQQEANYITEVVRREYLIHPDNVTDVKYKVRIELEIDEINNVLKMNGKMISEGFTYAEVTDTILRKDPQPFILKIGKDGNFFLVETKFSKLK
ncbi:prepilin-type N-terminal cleavage/methylation domain-containing protein [Sporosarcina sp. FA9]|uniref:prepilin-type N-terminal cleavage/methylation domain-containing protein n=1 Tax=Sporosarcina sp. FA9 TaxID=3413030 RepID=UPI003F65B8C6